MNDFSGEIPVNGINKVQPFSPEDVQWRKIRASARAEEAALNPHVSIRQIPEILDSHGYPSEGAFQLREQHLANVIKDPFWDTVLPYTISLPDTSKTAPEGVRKYTRTREFRTFEVDALGVLFNDDSVVYSMDAQRHASIIKAIGKEEVARVEANLSPQRDPLNPELFVSAGSPENMGKIIQFLRNQISLDGVRVEAMLWKYKDGYLPTGNRGEDLGHRENFPSYNFLLKDYSSHIKDMIEGKS